MVMITKEIVDKLTTTVSAGLIGGLGAPRPGEMCIEAAICYTLGLQHGDRPTCVHQSIRGLSIALNDAKWSSNKVRADSLKNLAIAQLGTNTGFNAKLFASRASELAIRTCVPTALRIAASACLSHKEELLKHANECEKLGTKEAAKAAAKAAYAATYTASKAAYAVAKAADAANAAAKAADAANAVADAANAADAILSNFAKGITDILIEMKTEGSKFLIEPKAPKFKIPEILLQKQETKHQPISKPSQKQRI